MLWSSTSFPNETGLYLRFADGQSLALTRTWIDEESRAALSDAGRIAPAVKEAAAFQLCDICPKHGSGETCHAIRPVLAGWEVLDRYMSHHAVTAAYYDHETGTTITCQTTMQRALQFISILMLLFYCEVGQKFRRYYFGVHPLMPTDEVVARVFLNMFWACGGDMDRTRALIDEFDEEIATTTRCQLDRIRLFCRSDAIVNALILTQIASEFLAMNAEDILRDRIQAFERTFFA